MKSVIRSYRDSAAIYGDWLQKGLDLKSVTPSTVKPFYTLTRKGNLDYTIGYDTELSTFIACTDSKSRTFNNATDLRSYMNFLLTVGYVRGQFFQTHFDTYVK